MNIEHRLLELARKECANHQRQGNYGKTDYCLREPPPDHRCVFATREGARCRYFEEGVLPLDPELQALYEADREARACGDQLTKERAAKVAAATKIERVCAKCGRAFAPTSPRQLYCATCQRAIRNAQARRRMQRMRTAGE